MKEGLKVIHTHSTLILLVGVQSHGQTIARESGKYGLAECLGKGEDCDFHDQLALCYRSAKFWLFFKA